MVNPIGPNQPPWPPAQAQRGVESPSDMLDALLGQLQQAGDGDPSSDSSSPSFDLSGFDGGLQAVDPSVASAIAGVQTSGDVGSSAGVPTDLAQAAMAAYMNAAQADSEPSEDATPGIDLFG